MQLLHSGWRGNVYVDFTSGIAKKIAKHENTTAAIRREAIILKKMKNIGISYVPHILQSDENSFSYYYIEGAPLKKIWNQISVSNKRKVAKQLINIAYDLDKKNIFHGELSHPTSNVLRNGTRVYLLDFERGNLTNFKSKNMKHLIRRLKVVGLISPKFYVCGDLNSRENLYNYLSYIK